MYDTYIYIEAAICTEFRSIPLEAIRLKKKRKKGGQKALASSSLSISILIHSHDLQDKRQHPYSYQVQSLVSPLQLNNKKKKKKKKMSQQDVYTTNYSDAVLKTHSVSNQMGYFRG